MINEIRKTFLVGKKEGEENRPFSYVGIELSKHEKCVELNQNTYQKYIEFIAIDKSRLTEKGAMLTLMEKESLQSKIGQILWIARQSRPDIVLDASNLASNLKKANVQTLIANKANKIVKNIKSESVTLKFQCLGHESSVKLVIFCDSSLGNLPDGGT